MPTTVTSIRMDNKLHEETKELSEKLGISLNAAINIFLKQYVKNQGFPFDINLNDEKAKLLKK